MNSKYRFGWLCHLVSCVYIYGHVQIISSTRGWLFLEQEKDGHLCLNVTIHVCL